MRCVWSVNADKSLARPWTLNYSYLLELIFILRFLLWIIWYFFILQWKYQEHWAAEAVIGTQHARTAMSGFFACMLSKDNFQWHHCWFRLPWNVTVVLKFSLILTIFASFILFFYSTTLKWSPNKWFNTGSWVRRHFVCCSYPDKPPSTYPAATLWFMFV